MFDLDCFLFVLFLSALQGCGGIPRDALKLNRMTLEEKRLQTRYFDTSDETKILSASREVLQDLGFELDESEADLGLVAGSKDPDTTKAGHVLLAAILTGLSDIPDTYRQRIRISVVSSPAEEDANRTSVRVSFQRIVWDNYGRISKLEGLHVPELYRGFFDKFSRALSLKAHGGGYESSRSQVLAARGGRIKLRNIQSRIFDTTDKVKTLCAVMATLQDLGFMIRQADEALGSVRAIKLDCSAVRLTVNVRSQGETQMRVHVNARYNLKAIEESELYRRFFAALEDSMFLTAHTVE